jgi:Holliday junction DNA helicase RuvA
MIGFVSGKVLIKKESFVILEKSGIGFKIFLSENSLKKVKEGEKVDIFCHFCIRNEKPELYGFLTFSQLEVFEVLEKISGIGPKAALIIASLGGLDSLKRAVEKGDQKYFQGVKGIGRKKIQKIILELTGKIKEIQKNKERDPALDTLISLGFSKEEAKSALLEVPSEIEKLQERVKFALKILGGGRKKYERDD